MCKTSALVTASSNSASLVLGANISDTFRLLVIAFVKLKWVVISYAVGHRYNLGDYKRHSFYKVYNKMRAHSRLLVNRKFFHPFLFKLGLKHFRTVEILLCFFCRWYNAISSTSRRHCVRSRSLKDIQIYHTFEILFEFTFKRKPFH